MNREEHMEWCKSRALEYVDSGDIKNALASMGSDLEKHPETAGHAGMELGLMLKITGNLYTKEQMREFINGFN